MAGAIVMLNDISAERLEASNKLFPYLKTYHGDDLAGFVKEQTGGRGLDIAVTACPVPSVQAAMLPLMNYGGRINFFGGIPESKQPVPINTNLVHYKELYLTGSTRSSIAQFRKSLDLWQKAWWISRASSRIPTRWTMFSPHSKTPRRRRASST